MNRGKAVKRVWIAVLSAVLCGGAWPARADIVIVPAAGPDFHLHTLNVPPEPDVVTLNPDPVTYLAGASDALKARLAAEFPTFTFTYAAGLSGELYIHRYEAASRGPHHGGGKLVATYFRADGDPAIASLHFLQLVDSSIPLGGDTSPYIDPRPNDDTLPFYWTTAEDVDPNLGKKGEITYQFSDFSSRVCLEHPSTITWRGELMLSSWDGGTNVTVYDGILWGWDFVCAPAPKPVVRETPKIPPDKSAYRSEPGRELHFETSNAGPVRVRDLVLDIFPGGSMSVENGDEVYGVNVFARGKLLQNATESDIELSGFMQFIVFGKAGQDTGIFDAQVLSLGFSGMGYVPSLDKDAVLFLQMDPSAEAFGQFSIIGSMQRDASPEPPPEIAPYFIDSFFDLPLQLAVDFGPSAMADGLFAVTLVPEPSAIGLLGLGLLALLGRRAAARRAGQSGRAMR